MITSPGSTPARAAGDSGRDANDEGTLKALQAKLPCAVGRDGLRFDAEPATLEAAVGFETFVDLARHGAGNGETDAAVRFADDGGIDADHAALHIDQRPAAIAGIYRGIGLQKRLVGVSSTTNFGAKDARGHAAVESEWVADGQHPIPHFELVTVTPFDADEIVGIDLEQGEIGEPVDADQAGVVNHASVTEFDVNGLGCVDNVIVGEDVALGVDDDTRSLPGANLSLEKIGPLILQARSTASGILQNIDVDDGWSGSASDPTERLGRVG